jgi:tetratricopeptide (TPR) repeat protein
MAQSPGGASVGTAVAEVEVLRVPVGPHTEVARLPRVRGDIVELVVRECPVELDAVLNMRNTSAIRSLDALRGGQGVWYLRVGLRDPKSDLAAEVVDGEMILQVLDRPADVRRLRIAGPTVEQIVKRELPDDPPRPAPLVLSFLPGDAMSLALDPRDYVPIYTQSPSWLPRTTWDAIDRARNAMLSTDDAAAHTQAQYRLGLHYLEMGFAKEARFYFGEISRRPGPVSQEDLSVVRARAALANGDWEEARERLVESWFLGAPEIGVLEGLAVVSLATADPPRGPTGRALAEIAGRPEAQLLAAELLQRDGYVAESRPILDGLPEFLSGDDRERASLRLADALFMDGETPDAARHWQDTSPDIAEVRLKLVSLLHGDPAGWPRAIPSLVQASIPRTDAAAEALYLLAQIDLSLLVVSRADAIADLARFMSRYPKKSTGSDVPERFWKVYSRQVDSLADAERWFDLAALHESVWNRTVRRAVEDAEVLTDVARAYEEVGLPDRAIIVLRDATSVLVAKGRDDPRLVYDLARLYAKAERWQDGLDSIAYLRRVGVPPELRGDVVLLEARLHEGNDDLPAAARALRVAAQLPGLRDIATVQLALMDAEAGACERAGPTLSRLLFSPKGEETWLEPRPWLALSRCLRVTGDLAGAGRAARAAAERTASPEEGRYTTWLSAAASEWKDEALIEELSEGDDIWASMAREQKEAAAFEAELATRRTTTWERER